MVIEVRFIEREEQMNKKEIEALEKMLNKVLYNIAEP